MLGRVSEKTDTFAFGVVVCELLTGLPPADYEVGETLAAKMAKPLMDAARLLPPLLDKRLGGGGGGGGAWPLQRAIRLGRVAARCIEPMVSDRCVVAEVLPEIAAVAGRAAVVMAGRGEEYVYDGETVQLVQTEQKKMKKEKTKKAKAFFGARTATAAAATAAAAAAAAAAPAAGHDCGGAGMLDSDKTS
jgi:hypothetical protein